MDKSLAPGAQTGTVFSEVRNALYDLKQRPLTTSIIYGLGGRDTAPRDLRKIYEDLMKAARVGQVDSLVRFLGLKE
jgi:pyruvate/2-oxoacid:ferredoxin oxidoreductase alpha subunit